MNDSKPKQRAGLHSQDKQQGDLRDTCGGTYGVKPKSHGARDRSMEERTAHEDAQPGADVRPDGTLVESDLPAGLQRGRKGPLNPKHGRG